MATEIEREQIPSAGMGGLVSEFGGHIPVLPWLLLAVIVGGAIALKIPVAGLAAGPAAGVAIAGGGLLLSRYRARQLDIKVHSGGLIYQGPGKTETWRWNDVEEFVILIEEREFRSAPHSPIEALFEAVLEATIKKLLPKAIKYRISYELRRPGHTLVLKSSVQDYRKLGGIVENSVRGARLPGLLASFRDGHTLPFGKLLFGPDGLTEARSEHPRRLPLTSLAGISVSKYAVVVHRLGGNRPWVSAQISTVPNAAILAALAEIVVAASPDLSARGQGE